MLLGFLLFVSTYACQGEAVRGRVSMCRCRFDVPAVAPVWCTSAPLPLYPLVARGTRLKPNRDRIVGIDPLPINGMFRRCDSLLSAGWTNDGLDHQSYANLPFSAVWTGSTVVAAIVRF